MTCRGGSLVEKGSVLLRPDNAGVPQRVDDGVVHDGVRLAPLALHRLERLQRMHPTQCIATQGNPLETQRHPKLAIVFIKTSHRYGSQAETPKCYDVMACKHEAIASEFRLWISIRVVSCQTLHSERKPQHPH